MFTRFRDLHISYATPLQKQLPESGNWFPKLAFGIRLLIAHLHCADPLVICSYGFLKEGEPCNRLWRGEGVPGSFRSEIRMYLNMKKNYKAQVGSILARLRIKQALVVGLGSYLLFIIISL